VLQYFIPDLLIQNFGVALSELFILLTIQDFDQYLDRASDLFNRSGLFAQLDILERRRLPRTVFLITLDTFDFMRQAASPEVPATLDQTIATRLLGTPRSGHFGAWLGTGQFALVVADQGPTEIRTEAEALVRQIGEPWTVEGNGLSARLCEIRFPEDTEDPHSIIKAQHRLSQPWWEFPRNVIIPFRDLSLLDSGRELLVAEAIERALDQERLEVHYQPIVSARTGKVVSAEALVRLHDEELGWIPPDEFIPIAERKASIHRIGDSVANQACAFLAGLRAQGLGLEYLEINLSAVECIQVRLTERLVATAQRHGLKPGDLALEITETAANLSPTTMRANMESLANAGFPVAIDDFGTGYSNIVALTEIPFQIVKFDRSLLQAMQKDSRRRLGIGSMATMFRRLGVGLVAEGVETEEDLALIRGIGIDLIQGYYFSKPLPSQGFIDFLRAREG
jgi:EAL domain-containing protein (putative c-di-GMP-specific phosphodiesterase class I)/GGDEF domain-containing protein